MSSHASTSNHPTSPILVTVREAAELLGIGRTKLYELILSGEMPTVSIGRARRVSIAALHEYVRVLESQA